MKQTPLKVGDTVRILSPSATCMNQPDASAQQAEAEKVLNTMGLKVEYGKHTFGKFYYKAGTVAERLADFHDAFTSPQVKAVIAMQGGNNSNELLPGINWKTIQKNPKYFLGSSDITVLLNAIYKQTGLITYHGVDVLWGLGKNSSDYTTKVIQQSLFQNRWDFAPKLKNQAWKAIRAGTAEGICLGGCLPSFNLLLGTTFSPFNNLTTPFIFIMESIGQSLSELESNIAQLTQQPAFQQHCRGIIVGYFFLCKEENAADNRSITDIVAEYTANLDIPILEIGELGHAVENIIFPIGAKLSFRAGVVSSINMMVPPVGIEPTVSV